MRMEKAEVIGKDKQEMKIWTTEGNVAEEKAYSYEEALDLTGNGRYSYGLLAIAGLSMLGTGMDMFGLSVVVVGASCDLNLDQQQMSILLATPFAGAIIMAYPWGYIADTKGRKTCLQIAMTVSFTACFISIFSINWLMMAVLKVISCGFSSCSQSVSYAILGESVRQRVRGTYLQLLTSILMLTPATYYVLGYWILNYSYSYNFGFMVFTPWRMLVLLLSLPLGISAAALTFFYESPKFLINAGQEDKALGFLELIWKRNNAGDSEETFPVKKIILIEEGNTKKEEVSFLKSLWDQIAPLFKPPLLKNSLMLYYLIGAIFFINNSLIMWFPALADSFFERISSNEVKPEGLCQIIYAQRNVTTEDVLCTSSLDVRTALTVIAYSIFSASMSLFLSKFATRKKTVMMISLFFSSIAGVATSTVHNDIGGFAALLSFLSCVLTIGFAVAYIIELFPTSYRGMGTCLYVMVARMGGLAGTYLMGKFMLTDCDMTLYSCTAYLASAAVVACFLPPDRPKKGVK